MSTAEAKLDRIQESVANLAVEVAKSLERMELAAHRSEAADTRLTDHEARLRVLEVAAEQVTRNREAIVDHEARMRSSEQWRWKVAGLGAATGLFAGTAGTFIAERLLGVV